MKAMKMKATMKSSNPGMMKTKKMTVSAGKAPAKGTKMVKKGYK